MYFNVDDKLPSHPKILKAGDVIGENGAPLALAMFVAGLAYANEHLTDGFIPDAFVTKSASYSDPVVVARALTNRNVGLWKRVRGGYTIHDFHDWNRTASEVKDLRAKWRRQKAAQKRGGNGQFHGGISADSTVESETFHGGIRADSHRTRARDMYLVRTRPRSKDPGTSTVSVQTARVRVRYVENRKTKTATHRALCSMLHTELNDGATLADAIEGTKRRCAQQGFAYPDGDRLDAAIQAVARRRRIA